MSEAVRTSKPPADLDLSGRDLGGYRLLRRLGRGAMAEVYLAEQLSLGRQVALKVLRSDLAHDDVYVKRFHQEARAAASLVHANIVQIYEVGRLDGVHFIAQEYVRGLNLGELLTRRGVPQLKVAIAIMRQVTLALCKAADQGIVHRDIKPENIMLTVAGEAKVADFGLARVATDEVAVGLTQAGFTMGTPLYMSPEQVQGKTLDSRSDIYSFGVTCYHMFTGELPFHGDTALAVAVQHLQNPAPRLENVRPDLPPAVCRIVHKMLAKLPADRYASPKELLAELRTLPIDTEDSSADDAEYLSQEFASAAADERRAATTRLDELMKTEAMVRLSATRSRNWAAAAVVLGLSGGLMLAWFVRPEPMLLGVASASAERATKSNARDQLNFARQANTEQDWQSVIDFPGATKDTVREGRKGLAVYYLRRKELDKADQLFKSLEKVAAEDTVPALRSFAMVGQAIVSAQRADDLAASAFLESLWESRDAMDASTKELLQENLLDFSSEINQRWQSALRPEFRPGPPDGPPPRGNGGPRPDGPSRDGPGPNDRRAD